MDAQRQHNNGETFDDDTGLPVAVLALSNHGEDDQYNEMDLQVGHVHGEFHHPEQPDHRVVVEAIDVMEPWEIGEPDDAPPDAFVVAMEENEAIRIEEAHVHNERFAMWRRRHSDIISSYLFDLIREEHTCTSILGGWSRQLEGSCKRVVEFCSSHRQYAFYVSSHGRTALHEACLRGSCSHIIRALLQANAFGVLDRDHQGNTPLHLLFVGYSTQRSSIHRPEEIDSIVADLLAISPTFLAATSNVDGNTALHIACSAPETMVPRNRLMQLLEANPSAASRVNNSNQTPLRLHCQRRNASVEVARILFEAHPDTIFLLDNDGWAPLHYAAANTNVDLISYLLEANPEAARLKTSKGETALHLMCRQSTGTPPLSSIDKLLEADPDAVIQRDQEHLYTPLHLLCLAGSRVSIDVLHRLIQSNPQAAEIADADHYLPLHHACENGCDANVVAALLEAYPSSAYAMTRKQDSPLSLACTCNKSVETVQMLINANPSALVKKNDYGFAPLHCVCRAYQPRMGIVQALLEASPSCVALTTHAGETPIHMASSNSGAFVGVLQLLTMAQNGLQQNDNRKKQPLVPETKAMTNKVGNTPLHDACFRGAPFEHIETLAMSNPEWISVRNNGGYSPFQILCKNGRIDERIVNTFSRIGGPEIFSVIDSTGNTPLHSAMRDDIDVATLKCLIRALPDSLHLKTIYGDSPLHLACIRRADPAVVREIALASSTSTSHASPILEPNTAGQTPIGIAMEEFRTLCLGRPFCCVSSDYLPQQRRVFEILATLVKILYYGPGYQDHKQLSLLRACVALHRQDVRLDPAFIRRALHVYPEEARVMDDEGNYPLHIEASIPIEKMFLLDSKAGCCDGECHKRMNLLRMLLEVFPGATEARNKHGHFPLNLMIQNGRVWGHEVALALRSFPPALHWHKGLDDRILAFILEKASKECGVDTLFSFLSSRPDVLRRRTLEKVERPEDT